MVGAFRRLGVETYTVGRLLWRGGARTRGQYRLIERNSQDLATLVPFTVVAVMPGGFFILPILVKLFPNFVPSAFRGKNYKVFRTPRARTRSARCLKICPRCAEREGAGPDTGQASTHSSAQGRVIGRG